jgi:REP element-mobilizing transposase RayT
MRTPQRRYYIDEAAYFITAATHCRQAFFRESVFADLFVVDLWFASRIMEFRLYGYTVAGDHVHLLVQPMGPRNISQVMASLKRNVSRDINDMIQDRSRTPVLAGDDSNRPLQVYDEGSIKAMMIVHPTLDITTLKRHFELLRELRLGFGANSRRKDEAMKFQWQKSFYDHVIRGEQDFLQHLNYILGNAVKHKLTTEAEDWRWMWVYGMDEPEEFQ